MTHPFTTSDGDFDMNLPSDVLVKSGDAVVPESDESNLPPTSSDRDTEDDARSVPVPRVQLTRPRWDSGSEMDSLVSTVVKRASARRRKTPVNLGQYLFLLILCQSDVSDIFRYGLVLIVASVNR